jgi:CheY-like chemotaxis protein
MSNPVDSAGHAQRIKETTRPAGKAGKMRVLVVDDEPGILELLKTALGALGAYEVSIASSGMDALRIIDTAERPFDCLLLDIQMPKMNGITLCREVRQIPLYQDTPIIMLTAMSEKKYVDQAFTSGTALAPGYGAQAEPGTRTGQRKHPRRPQAERGTGLDAAIQHRGSDLHRRH